ncbi:MULTISPECIES: hypothetical protein [unclassified Microbacterium]|uniref:hypothetical protein n=1 Tax=unclassified Microbacterium TaxID=2609290 RepID=UPI001FCE9D87|nr:MULTISPECIES: hypothetical protein [unclassified Microbacterium]
MQEAAEVVVVEDDPTVREAVGAYLRANGYVVSTFGDGVSARTALRDGTPTWSSSIGCCPASAATSCAATCGPSPTCRS